MIKSFLSDCTCFIQNGQSCSDTFTPKNGVTQGSCLSPLLFIRGGIDLALSQLSAGFELRHAAYQFLFAGVHHPVLGWTPGVGLTWFIDAKE